MAFRSEVVTPSLLPGIIFDTQDCVGVFTLLLFLLSGIVFDTYQSESVPSHP